MGAVEVEAPDTECASQVAWDKLRMEDDIFTVETINNVKPIIAPNDERSVATDDSSE